MNRLARLVLFSLLLAGCGGKQVATDAAGSDLDEPDRVLYDRAMKDLGRSRYNVARLALQTLINTYPDSEYLPQAKYALAESFYREGTTSMLNQAESEFKDYITFFPTSDLTDDAQLMVAMTHVKQLEKPDRDRTQALLGEIELKRMIETYPDSPLLADAKEKLRAVQEILAEGVFGIGSHYFLRKAYPASAGRYREVLEKYPDSRLVPEALFLLAESLRRNDNEPESAIYYARLVSDYPASERVGESKRWLTAMNRPIPDANPVAIANAQARADSNNKGIFGKVFSVFSRRPDVPTDTTAASVGASQDSGETKEDGTFTIDPKVVQPGKPPATKP